jgi:response regulator of citrate/malate metabolism
VNLRPFGTCGSVCRKGSGMKRDPLEIIEEMFKMLERGRAFSVNELAQQTGMHNITVKKYIQLIQIVRKEPEIEIIKTRHSIILRIKR